MNFGKSMVYRLEHKGQLNLDSLHIYYSWQAFQKTYQYHKERLLMLSRCFKQGEEIPVERELLKHSTRINRWHEIWFIKEGNVQQTWVTTRMTLEKGISVYCQDTFFPLFSPSILDNFSYGLSVQRGHNFPDTGDHFREQVCSTESNFLVIIVPKIQPGSTWGCHIMQEIQMNLMTNLLQSVLDFKAALQKKLLWYTAHLPWVVLNSLKPEYRLLFFKLRNKLSTTFHVSTCHNLKFWQILQENASVNGEISLNVPCLNIKGLSLGYYIEIHFFPCVSHHKRSFCRI